MDAWHHIDFEAALTDPASVYDDPEQVLTDVRLDYESKRAILKSWEADARELMTAEDEAMGGGEPNLLDRVLRSLGRLERSEAREEDGNIPAR